MKILLPSSIIISIVGGIAWLTNIHYTSSANAEDLRTLKHQFREINTRLSRIEGKLDSVRERIMGDK